MMDNTCVVCGEMLPEGVQVCHHHMSTSKQVKGDTCNGYAANKQAHKDIKTGILTTAIKESINLLDIASKSDVNVKNTRDKLIRLLNFIGGTDVE